MRRAHFLIATVFVAGGCRAVLGIQPLEYSDAGGGAEAGGAGDATTASDGGKVDGEVVQDATAGDARSSEDGGRPPPPELPDCGPQGSNCNMCCRSNSGPSEQTLEQYALDSGCLCGDGGACEAQCAGSQFCAGVGGPPPPTGSWPNCGPCVGQALGAPACQVAENECAADKNCKPVLDCLTECP